MYKLKDFIEKFGENRVVNKDIKVSNGSVFVKIDGLDFMYENQAWYQFTNRWVDLQGGVPDYVVEENLDERLFEKVEEV